MHASLKILCDGIPYPEGPVFDAKGNLFVCARRHGYIVRRGTDGNVSRFVDTGGKPNGLTIDTNGQLLIADATRQQILACSPYGKITTLIDREAGGHSLLGPNDLCTDSDGRLYFTDPGLDFHEPQGVIYRWDDSTQALECLANGLAFPNGLAHSHENSPGHVRLYFVETVSGRLNAITLSGSEKNRCTTVAELGQGSNPDGMTWLDADHLLITLHGWGRLAIVNPVEGRVTHFELGHDCHPTNVILHHEKIYITDDGHQAVLTLDQNVLAEFIEN